MQKWLQLPPASEGAVAFRQITVLRAAPGRVPLSQRSTHSLHARDCNPCMLTPDRV